MSNKCFDDLIADGKIAIHNNRIANDTTVLHFSLTEAVTRTKALFTEIYLTDPGVAKFYEPLAFSNPTIAELDKNDFVDFAFMICYNRLRTLAEHYRNAIRTSNMNPRAPVNNKLEFPTLLSSIISGIGPLFIKDGPVDILAIYATPSNQMANFGFAEKPDPSERRYSRFLAALKSCGYATSPIDMTNVNGSYFSTCTIWRNLDGLTFVRGAFHESHYQTHDVIKTLFFVQSDNTTLPFETVNFTADQVADPAVIKYLADNRPTSVHASVLPNTGARQVHGYYKSNRFGIDPATASTSTSVTGSCWILGRGFNLYYTCELARNLTKTDVETLLHQELTKKGGAPTTAAPAPALPEPRTED